MSVTFDPPNLTPFAPKIYTRNTGGGLPAFEAAVAPLIVTHTIALTQAQYDALPHKEADVLYLIRG